jgi:hypothetical protein
MRCTTITSSSSSSSSSNGIGAQTKGNLLLLLRHVHALRTTAAGNASH